MPSHPSVGRALSLAASAASIPAANPRHRVVVLTRGLAVAAVVAAALVCGSATPALGTVRPTATADGTAWSVETADTAQGSDRPNFEFDVEPGEVIDDAFLVINTGSTPLELGAYAADAFTTPDGILDLRLPGEPSADSGTWIALDATELTLQPGDRTRVGFRISVPADAAPGDHPAGIVTSLVTQEAGSSLSLDRRLGIRVHLRVAGELEPAVEVTDVEAIFSGSANPFDGGTLTVSYTLRNTGNSRIAAMDRLAASGPWGLGALPASPEAVPEILPGSEVRVERTISGVAALGWITGAVVVTPSVVGIGATPLEPVTLDLSVPAVPWMLLLVLLVVIVLALGIVLGLRRRTRAAGETPPAS